MGWRTAGIRARNLLREPSSLLQGLPAPLRAQAWTSIFAVFLHLGLLFWKSFTDPSLLAYFILEVFFILILVRVLRFRAVKSKEKMTAIDKTNIIVRLRPDGTIVAVNPMFCHVSGYTESELVGRHHSTVVPKHRANSAEYRAFWERLANGRSHTRTYERISRAGESFWLQATYTPIHNAAGSVYEVLKIATDVTQQAKDSMQLRHKNTYLEHAAKILRHDMHSGINTYIPRGIKSLKRRLSPEIIEEHRIAAPLKLLEEGLLHTQKVYTGVKEFTNLVKPGVTLTKEPLDLGDILGEYLDTTSYKRQVVIDVLPTVPVNRALFCTAIDNLIRNGLKYNDSDLKLVAITMLDNRHLGVVDNGRGMSQIDFEEYSKPYVRGSGQVESGSGLGLNICIAILHEHGFPVHCRLNPEGSGTIIKVKIK
jgi:PAS domain S-box-containing protein